MKRLYFFSTRDQGLWKTGPSTKIALFAALVFFGIPCASFSAQAGIASLIARELLPAAGAKVTNRVLQSEMRQDSEGADKSTSLLLRMQDTLKNQKEQQDELKAIERKIESVSRISGENASHIIGIVGGYFSGGSQKLTLVQYEKAKAKYKAQFSSASKSETRIVVSVFKKCIERTSDFYMVLSSQLKVGLNKIELPSVVDLDTCTALLLRVKGYPAEEARMFSLLGAKMKGIVGKEVLFSEAEVEAVKLSTTSVVEFGRNFLKGLEAESDAWFGD